MYDIEFFQQAHGVKEDIVSGKLGAKDAEYIIKSFDDIRARKPFVFNIETTNYCNMTCVMCPRTSLMTRKNIWIDDDIFMKALAEVRSQPAEKFEAFLDFVKSKYHLSNDSRDENAFYFRVVSRCLILHGYGEPLLDKNIVARVRACTERGIPTYFSCVPANITVERAEELMQAGLTVLKFSMDGLDDELQKQVRGPRNNFEKSYRTILDVLKLKAERNYPTQIVPTMIALSDDPEARDMHEKFRALWERYDVFAYVKSQDNRWYYEGDPAIQNRSHYHQQYCEYPWTSLTVMADGSVVPCTQDYDTELRLGNIHENSLEDIWNGEEYRRLREWHVNGSFPKGHKCSERCDQKKLCGYLK